MVSRIILATVGGILIVVGVIAGATAIWGYTSIGTDGLVRIPAGSITPGEDARATIIDVDTFSVSAPYVGGLGSSELVVTSPQATAEQPLFIGAAATADADAYLGGVPYAAAFRDGGDWTVREVPGGLQPPDPASGRWLAQASGIAPGIVVPSQRPLSLVVLAPAGNPLGTFDLAVAFSIPDASSWLLGLAIAAGVLIALGALLLVLGLRRRRALGKHAAGAVVAESPVPDAVVTEETEDATEDAPTDEGSTVDPEVVDPKVADPEVADPDMTAELPAIVVMDEPENLEAPQEQLAPAEETVDGIAFVIDVDETEVTEESVQTEEAEESVETDVTEERGVERP